MEFSESLNFGNSTYINLESLAKKAINCNELQMEQDSRSVDGAAAGDIIEESPTNNRTSLSTTRSRIFGVSTRTTNRSRKLQKQNESTKANCSNSLKFRKSKSDSSLDFGIPSRRNQDMQLNNYSEFFRSEFTIEEQHHEEIVPSTSSPDLALIRVSQIQAAFDITDKDVEENAIQDCLSSDVSLLDAAIHSEDFRAVLSQTEQKEEQETCKPKEEKGDNVWQDSFLLSKQTTSTAQKEETTSCSPDYLAHFDQTSFIAGGGEERQNMITVELERSKSALLEAMQEEDKHCQLEADLENYGTAAVNCTWSSQKHNEVAEPSANQSDCEKSKTLDKTLNHNHETLKRISAWHLPTSVLHEYEKKGIYTMFDWQIECLRNPKVLFEHHNLVYSAPTSAGKTLVSEILLIKTILERQKKVLLILPFISVVREKMFYLQDLLLPSGYRVEGFFGGYTPPGGFERINVAICTIEKANAIVNRLLEQGKLDDIGIVVVDEIHLISDPGRGYILELLLAKILYISRKHGLQLQVVTMSATLANVELLQHWLQAELYITNFRPVALREMIKVGNKIYDCNMKQLRELKSDGDFATLPNDTEHVAQLCIETLDEGCSVVVFCPSKDWCEKLAVQLAGAIHALGKSNSDLGSRLRAQLKREAIDELKRQLKDLPTGLDAVLERTVTYGCAFHHAGLTTEERDLVESNFKSGALKIIVATSTLSSGVNLPARRVLIRTPLFGGKQMSSLTYRQMIGRAGRTGKDTLGESILVCTESNARIGRELITADLKPITSCLEMENSTHLKRALLEVISAGVASTAQDIESFVNCTLLSVQKRMSSPEMKSKNGECCLETVSEYIKESIGFLLEYEFIRLQMNEETKDSIYVATRLGLACLASSMPPTDGLILFAELQKSRRCFVLESDLHAVYLVTPYSVCYQLQELDWLLYLDLWEKLKPAMKKVGEIVGIKESFLVRAMRGQTKLDYKLMQIHKRFYIALALQELVNETPINKVAVTYKCNRGMLQSLQQMASTFAGIVTAFCNSLNWSTLALVVAQFKERLFFGIHHDLIDLMRLPELSQKRARALYDAGITNLIQLANADISIVEQVLYNSLSFDLAKQKEDENAHETEQRNRERNFFITGRKGLTVCEAAKLLVNDARIFVQYEVGVSNIKWSQGEILKNELSAEVEPDQHMSCEEPEEQKPLKRKSGDKVRLNTSVDGEQKTEGDATTAKLLKTCTNETENLAIITTKAVKDLSREAPRKGQEKVCQINEIQNNLPFKNDLNSKRHQQKLEPADKTGKKQEFKKPTEKVEGAKTLISENARNIETFTTPSNIKNNHELEFKRETLNRNLELTSKQNHKSTGKASVVQLISKSKKFPENAQKELETALNIQAEKRAGSKEGKGKNSFGDKETDVKKVNLAAGCKASCSTRRDHFRSSKENECKFAEKPRKSIDLKALTPGNLPLKASPYNGKPRRSPRNHIASSTRIEMTHKNIQSSVTQKRVTKTDEELFFADGDDDDSFQMNTGMANALKAADQIIESDAPVNLNRSNDDEIPSSQKCDDEVASYSETPHKSRFMRSCRAKNVPSPKVQQETSQRSSTQSTAAPVASSLATSSIEFSDVSMENSLIQNPQQLNASHILSCSKEETDAASSCFKYIHIIDICGNQELFKSAFKELNTARRLGLSLGIQKEANKRKPLIGGNLLINQLAAKEASADVQFTLDDTSSSYLAGVAFSMAENVVYFMNMQDEATCSGLTKELKCKYLCMLLRSTQCTFLIHDAKEQLKVLRKAIPEFAVVDISLEDPKVANWLLQPDKHLTFANLTQQFAPECTALVNLCGTARGFSSIGLDADSAIFAKVRCSIEACVTGYILKGQIENLERIGSGQLMKFFKELEMPLQGCLSNMEVYGFPASESALRKLFHQMVEALKKLEAKIYEMHGTRFNLGSTSAVAKVLGLHRKSNGRVSTSRQILEKIDSPISQLIIAYRKISVTLTKNIQPLLKCVVNDKIHGQSITFTSTGRISMTEPNLQNVAKDFIVELGAADKITISCRSAFYALDTKRCLIASDFCQLEMRILAHLSQDKTLLQVLNSETDVFTALAARWNKIAEDKVSEQLRNGTKQICYGIVYGMGMRALAEALKCTEAEASCVSEQFHAAYPGIRCYADKVVKFACSNGYIETITGRRRYLEHINSNEPNIRKQAERQAVNSAIQGSAADIAKSAIVRMERNIAKYRQKLGLELTSDVQLVLHLHDELIYEVPEEKAKKIAKVLSVTMENCVKLNVPLRVKLKIGKTWASLKEIKL